MTLGKGIEQLYVFAVFWALGVGFSLIYIFGVGLTKSRLASTVFDGIFGAAAIYLTWKVNLEVNNGEFRAFVLLGLILGCVTTYFTCKSTLDKLSAALYNLLTTKLAEQSDGTDLLQKVDSNTIRSGNTGGGTASLSATHESGADVRPKRTHRNVRKSSRPSRTRHHRPRRNARVSQIRRIRETMGRTTRSSKQG